MNNFLLQSVLRAAFILAVLIGLTNVGVAVVNGNIPRPLVRQFTTIMHLGLIVAGLIKMSDWRPHLLASWPRTKVARWEGASYVLLGLQYFVPAFAKDAFPATSLYLSWILLGLFFIALAGSVRESFYGKRAAQANVRS